MSLGEGATSEGEFWESLNTACRLHLPVLYVVADNGYAISVRSTDQAPAPISEMVRGIRGLHVVKMDGRDYFEVRRKGADAIAHVRAGAGPCLDPRAGDAAVLALALRRPEEVPRRRGARTTKREHDPIVVLEQQLVDAGALDRRASRRRCAPKRKETVRAAADAALAAPRPAPATACSITSSGRRRSPTIPASPRSRPTPTP